ncbi:hypothetical protein HERIO_2605 [Hepatospora eriocheir]|uniref:C2H2-type domain-containing protein n=1 Tax=Hepatospora eriocheir TaxID=1081669 RepID=A0A1X0Q689_9MICR|nr:hypothetical protein HERIO_2605 [Hepatospora eriocheir]
MFCTCCECEVKEVEHYQLDWHIINAKRKLNDLKPIKSDEVSDYIEESVKSEDSIDSLELLRYNGSNDYQCLFCTREETIEHYYYHHELTLDQIGYIKSYICFECKEGFSSKKTLRKHFEVDIHRECWFDGINLCCSNGRLLGMNTIKHAINIYRVYPELKLITRNTIKINSKNFNKRKVSLKNFIK